LFGKGESFGAPLFDKGERGEGGPGESLRGNGSDVFLGCMCCFSDHRLGKKKGGSGQGQHLILVFSVKSQEGGEKRKE